MLGRWYFLTGLCVYLLTPRWLYAQTKVFDSNGVKIHYVVMGQGEPVLLIHGFAANHQMQWTLPGVMKALAKDYQVIAYDNRGHGASGKPHDPKQYGTEFVEDAVRLLDHLKIPKAHVVGYSMGALITGKLITMHPERIQSATLGGAGILRDGTEETLMHELADSLEQGRGFRPLFNFLTPDGKAKPNVLEMKSIDTMLGTLNDTKALAAVVRSWKNLTVSDDKLKSNQVPVLALIGDLDPLKKGIDAIQGRLANLEVVVLEKGDHFNTFVRPEFVQHLKAFLARHKMR